MLFSATKAAAQCEQNLGDPGGTDMVTAAICFQDYCASQLPFLRGQEMSDTGVSAPEKGLCIHAICCIFGARSISCITEEGIEQLGRRQ